jgi:hypothetical protein
MSRCQRLHACGENLGRFLERTCIAQRLRRDRLDGRHRVLDAMLQLGGEQQPLLFITAAFGNIERDAGHAERLAFRGVVGPRARHDPARFAARYLDPVFLLVVVMFLDGILDGLLHALPLFRQDCRDEVLIGEGFGRLSPEIALADVRAGQPHVGEVERP